MTRDAADRLAAALRDTLISPNVMDSNGEPANIVDALAYLARSVAHAAQALQAIAVSPHLGHYHRTIDRNGDGETDYDEE